MATAKQIHDPDTPDIDTEDRPFLSPLEKSSLYPTKPTPILDRLRAALTTFSLPLILVLLCVNIFLTLTYNATLPTCPSSHTFHNETFGLDRRYESLAHAYDDLWDAELTERNSLITVPPYYDENGQSYDLAAIAMFHQLHCLTSMRKALQKAHYGEQTPGLDWRDEDAHHWAHCLAILRGVIHCLADDTMELARHENGSVGGPTVRGYWDVRQCRDSKELYALRSKRGVEINPELWEAEIRKLKSEGRIGGGDGEGKE